jgi:hypothetical protein
MYLKLAALWRGELVAALGAVGEDEDFRRHIPEAKRRRYHRSSHSMAVRRRIPRFSRGLVRRCLERLEALEVAAEEDRREM